MERNPTLSQLLKVLSEESLFKLLQHVEARARRQILKGDKQGDVEALQTLQSAVELQHAKKLDSAANWKPDG